MSSASASRSEEEDNPLISFSPKLNVSKRRPRTYFGLVGKQKFELKEMRKRRGREVEQATGIGECGEQMEIAIQQAH